MNKVIKGRGAQIRLDNKFNARYYSRDESQVDQDEEIVKTRIYTESPKNIISVNDSPDIPFRYSINPYQGCEHGCIYCYARNSHEYWGFDAALDFETKIISKPNGL